MNLGVLGFCRVQDEGLSVQGFSLGFRVLRVFRAYLEFLRT